MYEIQTGSFENERVLTGSKLNSPKGCLCKMDLRVKFLQHFVILNGYQLLQVNDGKFRERNNCNFNRCLKILK